MKSRERVMKAIAFEEADRIPIDLGGTTGASGIHIIAYDRLKKSLGFKSPPKCYDVMQQLALMEPEVLERLHCDVVQINALTGHQDWENFPLFGNDTPDMLLPAKLGIETEKDGTRILKNKAGSRFAMPSGAYYFDAEDGKSWFSYPYELTDEFLSNLRKNTESIYRNSDYAISANFSGGFFETNTEFLMDIMLEPAKIEDYLSSKCEKLIERYKLINEAVGDFCFCVVFADDFGSQNAPLLSPDLFHDMIAPQYRKFTSWLHSNTKLKLFLHSCGAIEPLMQDIVDMGADILNPIQTSAANMDPAFLKQKYGKRLVFWGGGCDTQSVLGHRHGKELEEHVKERIKILAPGGGFVFNQIHAIQANICPEDICTLFDSAYKHGSYPVS